MEQTATSAVEQWLAGQTQHPLAIVPSLDVGRLAALAAELLARLQLRPVDLGRELGNALLDVPPRQRISAADRWLRQTCGESGGRPLLLTEIDLLFEPHLEPGSSARIDPLALLRQGATRTRIVALWPGAFDGTTLSYAVPEHAHYRYWQRPQAQAIRLDAAKVETD